MILTGLETLDKFKRKRDASRSALDAWENHIEASEWKTPDEIKREFPAASFIAGKNRVIFNIKVDNYRLPVIVRYAGNIVKIEWIGTHSEYNKMDLTGEKIRRKGK